MVGQTRRWVLPALAVSVLLLLSGCLDARGAEVRTTGSLNASASDDPPPTSAAVADPLGQQLGLFEDLQYLRGAALSRRLDDYAALGVKWARFQLLWADVQRGGPGRFNWGQVDAVVDGLQQRGIKPLAAIGTSPPWAARANGCGVDTCAPTDPAQFAAFAQAAARRYADRIGAWEIWNEPNIDTFYKPAPDAAAYTALLAAAYPAIKREDPQAVVLSGGLAPALTSKDISGRTVGIYPLEFLNEVYARGGQRFFDAVGWHPYCYPAMPGGKNPDSTWAQMSAAPLNVRAIMTSHGDDAKRIWSTEFGATTGEPAGGGVTEARQADYLAAGIALWRSYSWAGPMIVYQLRDRGTDVRDRENFFGLQRADGSPKPAYGAFRSLVVK